MSNTGTKRLFNRDFSLLIFGQIMSIFGNMILSFTLPLYILDISESASLYGFVLAVPYISLILISPFGGIIADRLPKQRVMFWLDAVTTVLIVLYMSANALFAAAVPLVIVKLLALNTIQGIYLPAVQASVPVLVPEEKLVSANSITNMINMFSSMAGMALAGILYERFGLFPILIVSAIAFAFTAAMDLLIRIPYKKQESSGSIANTVKNDISVSITFMFKEKPILFKCGIIIFFSAFTLNSMLIIGAPVLISQNLGFGMDLVGYSSSFMMLGGLIGGIAAGVLSNRLNIKKSPLLLLLSSINIIPIGLVFLFDIPAFAAYVIITAATALTLAVLQIAQVQFFTFVQREIPTELLGKIISLLSIMPFISNALGSFIYGILFDQFEELPWIVVFGTVAASALIAGYAYKQFSSFIVEKNENL